MCFHSPAEVSKLQTHLSLLREEYVKLQKQLADVNKKYEVALAAAGSTNEDNFVSRLLKTISSLYNNELYSDLTVKLDDGTIIKAHKFVLAARSDTWGVKDLSHVSELFLSDISTHIGEALLQWVYTDDLKLAEDDTFLLELMKAATTYQLTALVHRCEHALMSSVTVNNCIHFYQAADEVNAESLRQHCCDLISVHWDNFTSEDFEGMSAPLVYKMFKSKSQFPLHTAIRTKREDAVFLYLVEHDAELPAKLNEVDTEGRLPLDLALQQGLEGIAQTLIKHKVDVNRKDRSGLYLLHQAIKRGDKFSAKFLIENGANVNVTTSADDCTALHMTAACELGSSDDDRTHMSHIAQCLLQHAANVNAQDTCGNTPLHQAVLSENRPVLQMLLTAKDINLDLANGSAHTALWLALLIATPVGTYEDDSFAGRIVARGGSTNTVNPHTGDTLLHAVARIGNEAATLFLVQRDANVNTANHRGETPLHVACEQGLKELVLAMLLKGANPNAVTSAPSVTNPPEDGSTAEVPVYRQTPLHVAITNRHREVVQVFLNYKAEVSCHGNSLQIIPNFGVKDSRDQTPLALSLWQGFHDIAKQLMTGGASVNDYNSNGLTLLHEALTLQDSDSALFLLEHKADCNIRTKDNRTCLELAIKRHLVAVVDQLCKHGAAVDERDENGDCPLWQALDTGQEDIASILVQHGCDTNVFCGGPCGCEQTLLHRAIDENNETVACFLIRSLCDVDSTRRPGSSGEGEEEARDGQTALHMAATWGLDKVVQCLVEHNVNVNAQDAEGKTALHIAIENQHHMIISLLMSHPSINLSLQDKQGLTPFAVAMTTKNNKAAEEILAREPLAAEQFDPRGRNFLHIAIQKSDIESVLFLLSVHANVNSCLQDSSRLSPLHIAVKVGAEIIVRNLLLAGAQVNDLTTHKQTVLHVAASCDHAVICSVLLQNGVDCNAIDDNLCNALHIATQLGHLNTVRVLLTESDINAEAVNMRGQNPLHLLGQFSRENGAAIFELFLECMPNYPIDQPDINGNTLLMLAYFNGNANLCRAVVRAGAMMGLHNKDGVSIFNAPVATKQLLFKLLDMLSREPPWCEGDNCLECGVKFGIKTRKHHCRHCGRLLCAKCSDRQMPIIKYNITKPVRVCQTCFDVLTLGLSS
ncbi:hypothetical protein NP493_794g01007 [Ridgeia piscesae]|uniref:Ankyrin repeat and FYVE domain containing 1 n=1 Tax=Ridgeia piscesae TaxID=27915 RepID=A0AAD9KNF1_RIDPI|nr:hypothetical protein NP493_794g01007 [Ridgeia piscesae]